MESQVTERQFLEYLHELNHKISFLYEKSPSEIKCFNDIHDILYKLKIKVIYILFIHFFFGTNRMNHIEIHSNH